MQEDFGYTTTVEPRCRYCSDTLLVKNPVPKPPADKFRDAFYMLPVVGVTNIPSMQLIGAGFTVDLYRCPKCGYVEMFDDRRHHG